MPLLLPLAYSWRNVLARKASTAVTLAGVSISVMVFVVITATADGIRRVATTTGDPRNLIVLSKGARSGESSRLTRETVNVVRQGVGIARDENGNPLASEEILTMRSIPFKGADPTDLTSGRYTSIRGVTERAFRVHGSFRLIEGRLPQEPGEILIGRLLPTALGDVGPGDVLRYGGRPHEIVGVFAADGQVFEGEIWADLDDLRAELQQFEASIVALRVEEPHAIPAVVEMLGTSKRITVDVKPEREYYQRIQRASIAFVYLGNLIALFMGLGAVVAGMNTMYAAMSRRVREMGTLRALGFGRWNVASSLLFESVIIGALGGLVGTALALAFDGFGMNLVGLAFELDVRTGTIARGAGLALAIGFLGGLLPARTASRLEIIEALRRV